MKFFYCGDSMKRVFRNGDRLVGIPCPFTRLRPGDIVRFRRVDGTMAVHRIIGRCDGGFRTCGDNNPEADRRLLLPEHYLDRIAGMERGGRFRWIAGGRAGMFSFYCHRLRRRIRAGVAGLLLPPPGTAPLAVLNGLLGRPEKTVFRNREETVMLKHRIIARRSADRCWTITGPWRWFWTPEQLERACRRSPEDPS